MAQHDAPIAQVYVLMITEHNEDETYVFTTEDARYNYLVEYVTDNWDEHFTEPMPTDIGEATEKFHQDSEISWQLDDGPLQGPPLPAYITVAKLRAMFMGVWDGAADFLEAISEELFELQGFPPNQEIKSGEDLVTWREIAESWAELMKPGGIPPTPAEIEAEIAGADATAYDMWRSAHSEEAENQGWLIVARPQGFVIERDEKIPVFDNDEAALRYVKRQAKRGLESAIIALEITKGRIPKEETPPNASIAGR